MHHLMHRHLGKVVAGAAIALTGTAAMAAITLPADAGAAEGTAGRDRPRAAGAPAPGRDQGPPPPGRVEGARPQGERGQGRDPLTADEVRRAQD
ncbi:Tat pathway signal sequence domain protein, partial [Streptomyces decoyicus]